MIEQSRRGDIAVLTMAHGKANALDIELLEAITAQFGKLRAAPERAVVLTGQGRMFSAGVDLPRLADGGPDYVRRFLPALHRLYETVFFFPKPVVAAVNGHAIAGGCIVACACDHRLMARGKGRIGVPELLVGVPFPSLPLAIVRFATPVQHLQELVLGGATYAADEALARGLIDAVVDPDALIARACDIAAKLANVPPRSFALVKRDLRAPVLERWPQMREHDAEVREAWCAPETHAAIRRYLEQTLGKSR
jgi:enoyl-CoA hydratase